jgi:DNA-binding NtrC family response regulator
MDILTALKCGLEASNCDTRAFDDPLEASQFLDLVCSPGELISDTRMPAMTGYELARLTSKTQPNTRIVLMTSFEIHSSEFDKTFPSTKIDARVNKSVRINRLVDTVNVLVNTIRAE